MESIRHSWFPRGAKRRAVVKIGAPCTSSRPTRSPRWPQGFPSGYLGISPLSLCRSSVGRRGQTSQERWPGTSPAKRSRPRPLLPTAFMPSFQSPVPIRGSPCEPNFRETSTARTQWSYRVDWKLDTLGCEYRSSSTSESGASSRNESGCARIALSPVIRMYSDTA